MCKTREVCPRHRTGKPLDPVRKTRRQHLASSGEWGSKLAVTPPRSHGRAMSLFKFRGLCLGVSVWAPLFSKEIRGPKKHINFFNINFLAPTPQKTFSAPRLKFMCLISWERTRKGTHINFFGRIFGVKKGVPNGPFSATKRLVYCFFVPLEIVVSKNQHPGSTAPNSALQVHHSLCRRSSRGKGIQHHHRKKIILENFAGLWKTFQAVDTWTGLQQEQGNISITECFLCSVAPISLFFWAQESLSRVAMVSFSQRWL